MTTALTIRYELGDDADLLVKPDQWLENHHQDLANKASRILEELESVQKAQRFKRELQQLNKVAVLLKERTDDGRLQNLAVQIMSLPDAINLINKPAGQPNYDSSSLAAQVHTWDRDGYDIIASATLRHQTGP